MNVYCWNFVLLGHNRYVNCIENCERLIVKFETYTIFIIQYTFDYFIDRRMKPYINDISFFAVWQTNTKDNRK